MHDVVASTVDPITVMSQSENTKQFIQVDKLLRMHSTGRPFIINLPTEKIYTRRGPGEE